MNWEDFKGIYWDAYKGGAKGCTTFRSDGHREGILKEKEEENGAACYIDPTTGERSCED
jgi:ribonucleoside-diphosphate reductase alpha chain